jgi:phosphate transport system substrate-binding protein
VKLIAAAASLLAASIAMLATGCHRSDAAEIQIEGSNTMLDVASAWAETYMKGRKDVHIAVSGNGSGTGISALINGTVSLANSSRQMTASEIEQAKKNGHVPVEHMVGYDGIAIYVHADNPIEKLTLEQLKSIFGDGGKVTKWSDLGVKLADAKSDPMVLASRQSSSGTHDYFKEAVLGGKTGRFKPEANNLNGSMELVDFVAKTKSAIGYSGLAYAKPGVRMVPIVSKDGKAVAPSIDSVLDQTYPISRPLFMYTAGEPKGGVKEYLDWIVSDAGQRVLLQSGYPPLRKV